MCPLVPLNSYLITKVNKRTGEHIGVPIGICWRSVWMAWARIVLFLVALIGWLPAMALLIEFELFMDWNQPARAIAGLACTFGPSVASVVLILLSFRLTRATPLRALEVARLAGMPPEAVAAQFAKARDLDLIRGRLEEAHLSSSPVEDSPP
jgi:hypothetical protein